MLALSGAVVDLGSEPAADVVGPLLDTAVVDTPLDTPVVDTPVDALSETDTELVDALVLGHCPSA